MRLAGFCIAVWLAAPGSRLAQAAEPSSPADRAAAFLQRTRDQSAAIAKVTAFLRQAKDAALADRIAADYKAGKLDFDPAVKADDSATAAWYDPQTGRISINPAKCDEILARSRGAGANYGTVSLAATLRHEYVHEGQPAAMHQASLLNETRQLRAKETPAYDSALKGYQGWADAVLKDLALVELWPDGPEKAKRIDELGTTLKSLKGSYQDYLVGIRENRDAGKVDPNFEWTGINGAKASNPDYLDGGGRLDYGIKKAAELSKSAKAPRAEPPAQAEPEPAPKAAKGPKAKGPAKAAERRGDEPAEDEDGEARSRVIAALAARGLGAPEALVSRLAGILAGQGEKALNAALDSLTSMQGSFLGSGFTLVVKDCEVSGTFYERSEYHLPNAKVSVTVTDGKVTGWVDPASGAISFESLFVTNIDGRIEQSLQKLVGEFTGRGYRGHIVGQTDAKWEVSRGAGR